MTNYTIVNVENLDGTSEQHVVIDNRDGSFISMPKSIWDEMQAKMDGGEQ